jgi:hypothetical protein
MSVVKFVSVEEPLVAAEPLLMSVPSKVALIVGASVDRLILGSPFSSNNTLQFNRRIMVIS